MADKGIVVDDAVTGESVACVDLRNNDDDANARIVQLISEVTSPKDIINEEDGTPIRTLDFGTTGGKGGAGQGDDGSINTAAVGSGITGNMLDIGDASAFVVYGSLETLVSGSLNAYVGIKLTPLLYPDAGTKVGTPLPGAMLRLADLLNISDTDGSYDAASGTGNSALRVTPSATTARYAFLPMVFPTLGADRVGFHLRANQDNELVARLYAYPLTGAKADASLVALHVTENKLSSLWFNELT